MAQMSRMGRARWHYEGTVAAGATSEPLYMPDPNERFGQAKVGAWIEDGRIEYTLSSRAAVEQGSATWRTWPSGDVTTYTDDTMQVLPTAIRAVGGASGGSWGAII